MGRGYEELGNGTTFCCHGTDWDSHSMFYISIIGT